MGGEQAASVLATVAENQRALKGKQVNAISPSCLGLALSTERSRGRGHMPGTPRVQG